MIRRYSRPRHLMPGWTMPLRPWATKLIGLTTIPSPPRPVSSSHHATPSASCSASVTLTRSRPVLCSHPGSAATSSIAALQVPAVVVVGVDPCSPRPGCGTGPSADLRRRSRATRTVGRHRRSGRCLRSCRVASRAAARHPGLGSALFRASRRWPRGQRAPRPRQQRTGA